MKFTKSASARALLAGMALATVATPSLAQTAPEQKKEEGLDVIVVTAQRREESLQEVPIAVSAVEGDSLAQLGIQDTSQLAEVIPGLTYTFIAGNSQVRIRGVGTNSFGPGIENPVATYIDGVYVASTAGQLFDLANIERVEVLKGPQGTLFGRNATGGLVQIVTPKPEYTPSGKIKGSYGNYQTAGVDFYGTTGLTQNVAADFSVHYATQGEGYGKNVNTGNDVNSQDKSLIVRSKLLVEPTDNLSVVLTGEYNILEGSNLTAIQQKPGVENVGVFEKIFTNRLDADATNDLPYINHGGFYDLNSTVDPYGLIEGYAGTIDASLDLGGVQLQSISAYRTSTFEDRFDIERVPQAVLTFDGDVDFEQFSQELKMSGGTETFNYTAGLFYFKGQDGYAPFFLTFGPQGTFLIPGGAAFSRIEQTINVNIETESTAAYAQATLKLSDDTNLTVGGRYTQEDKSVDGIQSLIAYNASNVATPFVPAGTPLHAPTFDKTLSFNNFSYRVALDHQLADDVMVYASINTGFKSGGFNAAVPSNPAFEPEKITAYEVGLKSEWMDNRLRTNVSGFFYDYKDIQINNFIQTNQFISNGPAAEVWGIEAEALAIVSDELTLNGSVAYTHDRFTDYPDADYNYSVPDCSFANPSTSRFCQASAEGNKLTGTPDLTVNLGFNYETDLAGGLLGLNGNYFYSSGWFGTTDNDPRIQQEDYQVVNASIYYELAGGGPRFSLFGRNLLDEDYARTYNISSGQVGYVAAEPMTWGVSVEKQF